MWSERQAFTVQDGFDTRAEQLTKWERVLKPEYYELLLQEIAKKDAKTKHVTGYDVLRGQDIDMIVHNVLMKTLIVEPI